MIGIERSNLDFPTVSLQLHIHGFRKKQGSRFGALGIKIAI